MHLHNFAPDIVHGTPVQHFLAGIGSVWATLNIATYGASLLTLIPPLLIGIGSILAARNALETNRINKERLAFDRERWEAEHRATLTTPPVVVSAAETSSVPPVVVSA